MPWAQRMVLDASVAALSKRRTTVRWCRADISSLSRQPQPGHGVPRCLDHRAAAAVQEREHPQPA